MKFQSTFVRVLILCQALLLQNKFHCVFIKVREILAEYDPNFMPMGLDEAYLNITEHLAERPNWPEDRRRFFFNTESTTRIGKQITHFLLRSPDTEETDVLSFKDFRQNHESAKL